MKIEHNIIRRCYYIANTRFPVLHIYYGMLLLVEILPEIFISRNTTVHNKVQQLVLVAHFETFEIKYFRVFPPLNRGKGL